MCSKFATGFLGRAIAQAVSHRLPTTAARVRAQIRSCCIWRWGKFSQENFGFPCQFSFHRLLHTRHHLSSGAGTRGQTAADVPSGLSLTPPHETKKKWRNFLQFAGLTCGKFTNCIRYTDQISCNYIRTCETVYEYTGKVPLWPYEKQSFTNISDKHAVSIFVVEVCFYPEGGGSRFLVICQYRWESKRSTSALCKGHGYWILPNSLNEFWNFHIVFTDVMLCNLVTGYQRFRGTCSLHLQGRSGKHTSTWNTETAYFSEMLVAITQPHIPKDRTAVRTDTAACNSIQTVPGTPRIPGRSISVTARDKPKHKERNVVAGLEGHYSRPCLPLPTSKQYWTATEDKPALLTARQ
jgi:hypothetical protein